MVRVLVVEDMPLLRQGICHLLKTQPDIEVVGEAGDGREAIAKTLETRPDVVLMDVSMPHVDGLEATRQIKRNSPNTKVLVLTIHDEPEYVEALLGAGAAGYLLKSVYGPSLIEAVRLAAMGEMVLNSQVGKALVEKRVQASTRIEPDARDQARKNAGLSTRQVQILAWIAKGITNAEMGDRLGVSERTVKGHITKLFDTFGVGSRSEALAAAVRLGVLTKDEL